MSTNYAYLQLPQHIQEQTNKQTKEANDWTKMMQMMAMASKMDTNSMLGFALGKLLRGGFDQWKNRYDERGKEKYDEIVNRKTNSEATQPIVDSMNQAAVSDTMQNIFGDYQPTTDPYQFAMPDMTVTRGYYNPASGTTAVEQAAQALLPGKEGMSAWEKQLALRGL